MPLVLRFKGETTIPIELDSLTPQAAAGLSLPEIERFAIQHGNRTEPLAEFFDITGSTDDGELRLEGDLAGVHNIGTGMAAGRIVVDGSAGRHLGGQMSGGEIHVAGDAGDWLGAEMRGGLIRVAGNAGNLVGAAYRGSRKGMAGGMILVGGSVGDETGHLMRRGAIAIGGNAGDGTGFNMIAGSIYVFGHSGSQIGAGMRRGTIGLLGDRPPALLPTFRQAATYQPSFLRMTLLDLNRGGFSTAGELLDRRVTLYHGDMLALGRGEVLVAESR